MNGRVIMHGSDMIEKCLVIEQTGEKGVEFTCAELAPRKTVAVEIAELRIRDELFGWSLRVG